MKLIEPDGRRTWLRVALPCFFILVGVAALSIDVPVARWCLGNHCPRTLAKLCSLGEVFGHGLGVAMILLTVFVLDPAARLFLPRIAAAAFGAGLAADIVKLTVARERPYHFRFDGGAAATFGRWFPVFGGESGLQSFPSSHVAVAAGLAIALAWYYPRGRWLFAVLAFLVAGQRVTSNAHFVSDTCWGAAVGSFFAPSCLPGGLLDPLFVALTGIIGRTFPAASKVAARQG